MPELYMYMERNMKIKERIHNVETGITEDIERDATPEEIIAFEKDEEARVARITKENELAAARAEILAKLGLTEEEAAVLLS